MRNGYEKKRNIQNTGSNPNVAGNTVRRGAPEGYTGQASAGRANAGQITSVPRDQANDGSRNGAGDGIMSKTRSLVSKCVTEMTTVPEDLKGKPKEKIRFHTVKAKEKKPLPLSFIFIAAVFTLLLTYMLYDMVRINEFTIQVAKMNSELAKLEDEKREIAVAVDAKNDLIAIEERAKELGMVKKDQVEKRHINTEEEDRIEMHTPKKGEEINSLFTLMNSLGENFRGIMEYIN